MANHSQSLPSICHLCREDIGEGMKRQVQEMINEKERGSQMLTRDSQTLLEVHFMDKHQTRGYCDICEEKIIDFKAACAHSCT